MCFLEMGVMIMPMQMTANGQQTTYGDFFVIENDNDNQVDVVSTNGDVPFTVALGKTMVEL